MCLVAVIWFKRHFDVARGRREPMLRADEPGAPLDELPPLTMLVAAKDEEANIRRCITGLLAQDYPKLRLVAINDRSGDATGRILDELAAADARMTVIHVESLAPGWFGKNHAMRAGLQQARTEWFCFSDADCTYDCRSLLTSAMRFALREQVDFLSVLPLLEAGSFWERVIQPVCGAIMVYWFPPQKVNNPASSVAYANGAFMLMSRSAYDAIGGHDAVKATLNEDMHMARRAKAAGLRLRVIRGDRLYRVRMYDGFMQCWRGWTRIFFGCFATYGKLITSAVMLILFSFSPYLSLLLAPLAAADWPYLVASAALAVVAQQSILWRFYGLTGFPGWWAITYPLGTVLCFGITLNAIRRVSGSAKTTWRGTTYAGGAQTAPETAART